MPEDSREVLLRVGDRLRKQPEFVSQLKRFMDALDDPTITASVTDRVALLEDRMDDLQRLVREYKEGEGYTLKNL